MHRTTLLAGVAALAVVIALPAFLHAEDAAGNPRALIKTSMGDIEVELFKDEAPLTVANFLGLANGTKEWKDQAGATQRKPFFDGLTFHRVIAGFMIQGGCPKGDGTGDPGYAFEDEINATGLGLDKQKLFVNGQPHKWLGIRSQQEFQFKIILPLLKTLGHPSSPAEIQKLSPEQLQKLNEDVKKKLFAMTLKEGYELMGYKYSPSLKSSPPKKGVLAMANSGPNTNGSQFFINLEDTDHLTGKHTVFGKVVKGFDIVEKIGKVQVGAGAKPVVPIKIVSIRTIAAKAGAPK